MTFSLTYSSAEAVVLLATLLLPELLLLGVSALLVLGRFEARSAFLILLESADFLLDDAPPRLDFDACRCVTCLNSNLTVPSGRLRKLAITIVAILVVTVRSKS